MLERLFRLREKGTTAGTEIRAGVVTFLTMCYIVFVQRAVLGGEPPHGAGMDPGAVVVATCLAAAIGCFVMGLAANYPVALAPCMGENFFFVTVAGTTVAGAPVGWRVALTATFLSGALFLVLSAFRVREKVFTAIPTGLQHAVAVGIGVFIALIGLQKGGIVRADPFTGLALGDLRSPAALLSLFGLAVTAALWARRVRGAFLLGMAATAALGLALGEVRWHGVAAMPPSVAPVAFRLDFAGTLRPEMFPVVLVFTFMVLFDTVGTLVGVGSQAGLLRDGKLERAGRALVADAVGTTAGAALGSSTVSSYIESAAGVAEGGRTGLTAVTTGVLFLGTVFFWPLAEMVGGGATLPIVAPVMILVGCLMAQGAGAIDWKDPTEALPAFLVVVGMAFTYNIATGFALGFVAWPLLKAAAGRAREVPLLVWVLAVVFLGYFGFLRHGSAL